MWCRDITECLVTEGDRLEAMKEAEQMCVTVRQNKLLLFLIPVIGLHFHRFRKGAMTFDRAHYNITSV